MATNMIAQLRAEVTGMKFFKDTVDGKPYDTTKIYIRVRLDDSSGRARGFCTQEFTAGSSDIYHQHASVLLPTEFDLDIETVSTGKVMKQLVRGMRAVPAEKGKAS